MKQRKEQKTPIYDTKAYNNVFLDPGVKTFQSFYTPEGICGKIGDEFCKTYLDGIYKKIDHLCSLKSNKTRKSKTRYNMNKRCCLLRDKLKNKINDLHWKTCNFLCGHFQNIFIPSFEVKGMTYKKDRNIGSKTTRNMIGLSHFKFKERLLYCGKTNHNNIYIVPEHYTSKTCGACGEIHKRLGGDRIFTCPSCNVKLDRDYNGARNICLKTFSSLL